MRDGKPHTYCWPISLDSVAQLTVPNNMSEESFNILIEVIKVMKPGLVEDRLTDETVVWEPLEP